MKLKCNINQTKKHFLFEDEYRQSLKNLRFYNPDTCSNLKRSVPPIVHLTIKRHCMGQMFPGFNPTDLTELDREGRTLRNTNLPFYVGGVSEGWRHIAKIKKADVTQQFYLLAQLIQRLLTLPHTSENVERHFSSINLMTNNRNRLKPTQRYFLQKEV